jgi:hypothetical protein
MSQHVPILALVVIVAAAAVVLYSFAMFDRLVRAQYELYREAWLADGRPRGFFWRAPECTWVRSAWSRNRLTFVWLFKTPVWATEPGRCRQYLSRLRLSVLVWNVTIVAMAIWGVWALGNMPPNNALEETAFQHRYAALLSTDAAPQRGR